MGQKSIIKRYFWTANAFGGVIFPIYASFFVNYRSDTAKTIFIIGALMAGLMVGSFSYFLTRIVSEKPTLLSVGGKETPFGENKDTHQD